MIDARQTHPTHTATALETRTARSGLHSRKWLAIGALLIVAVAPSARAEAIAKLPADARPFSVEAVDAEEASQDTARVESGKAESGKAAAEAPRDGLAWSATETAECLALNIYFEARGEVEDGKIAVGYVVLNRSVDGKFPRSICEVVRQGGAQKPGRCQFSWWCDGFSDRPRDAAAWTEAQRIAAAILSGATTDPTAGALWYHADYVFPSWGLVFQRGPVIGRHVFYHRPQGSLAAAASLPWPLRPKPHYGEAGRAVEATGANQIAAQ